MVLALMTGALLLFVGRVLPFKFETPSRSPLVLPDREGAVASLQHDGRLQTTAWTRPRVQGCHASRARSRTKVREPILTPRLRGVPRYFSLFGLRRTLDERTPLGPFSRSRVLAPLLISSLVATKLAMGRVWPQEMREDARYAVLAAVGTQDDDPPVLFPSATSSNPFSAAHAEMLTFSRHRAQSV